MFQCLKWLAAVNMMLAGVCALAQMPNPRSGPVATFIPLNELGNHFLDRWAIERSDDTLASTLFAGIKPFTRTMVWLAAPVAEVTRSNTTISNTTIFFQRNYLYDEVAKPRSKRPILKHFYKTPAHLFHVDIPDFQLAVDPVLHLQAGAERGTGEFKYINTRGVEVEGSIANRVGFYSYIGENQGNFMEYVHERVTENFAVFPGEGRAKVFKNNANISDFLAARGYITVRPIKQIHLQFGQDRNFIGNGHRSLLLSDYAKDYLFLKIQTKVWRLQYQNLFTQMTDYRATNQADGYIEPKYGAFHTLSVNVLPNLNIALFEGVIFEGKDSTHRQFELRYLNPIVLYRSIEFHAGSADNVVLGLDVHWNFLNRFQLYGQVMLDDIIYRELLKGSGWWGNKWGLQGGVKYVNVAGIQNLDLQLEANCVRPYTYTHNNDAISYTHFHQPLAHPLGANFTEGLAVVRYQPLPKLFLKGTVVSSRYGADNDSSNFGNNVFVPNVTREMDFDNKIGQGISTSLLYADFLASWMLFHNVFIDLQLTARSLSSNVVDRNDLYAGIGLRMNVPERRFEF